MIWFGSSAGVALSNLFPESRSVGAWIRQGWHVAVAYPLGFFALLWLLGWQPEATARPLPTCGPPCPSGRLRANLRIRPDGKFKASSPAGKFERKTI